MTPRITTSDLLAFGFAGAVAGWAGPCCRRLCAWGWSARGSRRACGVGVEPVSVVRESGAGVEGGPEGQCHGGRVVLDGGSCSVDSPPLGGGHGYGDAGGRAGQ